MQNWCASLVMVVLASACGDNTQPVTAPLAHSDTLYVAAHEDDDMIFMQAELVKKLQSGASSTTVYATTAGPDGRGPGIFDAAKVAYGEIAGSQAWDCGPISLGAITVEHCRLRDRPISLLDFGLPDGGTSGDRTESLLHLIDGTVADLAAVDAGTVTSDSVVDVFTDLLGTTTPTSIETLELAGSHGRDNSSHLFVASIGLWAAARLGFDGPMTWHRGYNVDVEDPTLGGTGLADARTMLGYYEGCADYQCGVCGASCPTVLAAHETWLERQYAAVRVPTALGRLALDDLCLDASLSLGDCTTAPVFELEANGMLRTGDTCVTSSATDVVTLESCTSAPEQYWILDSEGTLWNGRPPQRSPDMRFDHVRCLTGQGAVTCGATLQVRWTLLP